jgi:SAM-dependent methyltransferase
VNLYDQLREITRRPRPFERYTARDLWTDPHVSARMLAFHLDGTSGFSSRPFAFIDRSAGWIVSRFGLGDGARVADFGCGPGLYTTRLAAAGAAVTGIDFSERSIGHAREEARRRGLAIEYVHADYLTHVPDGPFDLVTMIMCDYCALSPDQRRRLLDTFGAVLAPGGAVLLDVYSLRAFEAREESSEIAENLMGGFWSAEPYVGIRQSFRYEEPGVTLDRYTIIEADRTRDVYNWLQYFDREALRAELENGGFDVEEILGDVAGAPFDANGSEFAVIARKPPER